MCMWYLHELLGNIPSKKITHRYRQTDTHTHTCTHLELYLFTKHFILYLVLFQNSAKIIRSSVFGFDENLKVRDRFSFPQNNLVVTSIDIQSVEPVDQRTRDSLQKSVQLAIEITTNSQEAAAR